MTDSNVLANFIEDVLRKWGINVGYVPIPDVVFELVAITHPNSPVYNDNIRSSCEEHLRAQGIPIKVRSEWIFSFMMDVAEGMIYVVTHFDETLPGIYNEFQRFQVVKNERETPDKDGRKDLGNWLGMIVQDDDSGYRMLVNLEFVSNYAMLSLTRRLDYRHLEDEKSPEMLFSIREMAFLTGLEETTHFYQFHRNDPQDIGYKIEVTPEEYKNSPIELEAAAIQNKAIAERAMGISNRMAKHNPPSVDGMLEK